MQPTPDGGGYWIVASDGGVFAFGDAGFYGSARGLSANSPIVGIASTPDGRGYWEAAANGAVFAFGDAQFDGVAAFTQPVVGISSVGTGYRLVADDGSVYAFGGAAFYGSTGGQHLNKPVIGMSSTNRGYLTVAVRRWHIHLWRCRLLRLARRQHGGKPARSRTGFLRRRCNRLSASGLGQGEHVRRRRGWNVEGSEFSGGLGFSHANWNEFNTFGYPSDAASATPEQQIRVAVAFATAYWGNPNAAPDQNGCTGGY